MSRPRVVFMGTPDFAVPSLRAVASSCDVAMVVTRPDQPRGRGLALGESEVARAARALGLPVTKPANPNEPATLQSLAGLGADLFAVVAFGVILSRELLAVPRLGCINLHGSLLPLHRGASPVQRALWDGRGASGVTTLWMDEGIDTGDLILQRWEAIGRDDDAGSLAGRLAALGGPILSRTLLLAHEGRAPRTPQDRAAGSYAGKLTKADGVIEWALDAEAVWGRQRAVTPWPGATTTHRGRPIRIMRAHPLHDLALDVPAGTILGVEEEGVGVACRPGALLIERLKPEGRAEMSGAEWARGARLAAGERMTAAEQAHT